ncbi:MAG: hypothetical protein PHI70_02480 [Proteiniphilum sp.]|nr:hypothetical protein [Proteiniphilum sp.]MDD3908435.1 hypothetical protein [Proteiniphilum sp.]MDD4415643.1 hypothetical protein [Proteiniphilum sp.]
MKKDEFKEKTQKVLNDLADYISKLEDKAGEIADDAKEEYRERLEKLKELRETLSTKLDEYENVADNKWDVIKESAGSFIATVADAWRENYDKVAEAFKKDKSTKDTDNEEDSDAPDYYTNRDD